MTRPNRTDTPADRHADRPQPSSAPACPASPPPTCSSATHDVTLFESDTRLGGHAHTHDVPGRDGSLRIDSGFIVHNEQTYPHLLRLFRELDVPTQPTEMSMSITCEGCGLSYAGGRGPKGMFAQKRRARRPALRPDAHATSRASTRPRSALLADESQDPTWGEFLAAAGLLRLLRAPLRHPARRLRLVVRRPRRVVLPGPPPLPVPRPPRHADGDGLARPGAPSPAGRPPTSTGSSSACPTCARRAR